MSATTILTIGSNHIGRAERGPDGTWQVEDVLSGLHPQTVTQDPANPYIVYAGTQADGIFRSVDAGRNWRSAGLVGECVKSIAVSPHDSQTIYVGLRPAAVARSLNGGHTWTHLDGFRRIPNRWWWFSPAEKPYKAYVQALTVSPDDPDVLLAGIEFGAVVATVDGGKTWSAHRRGALRDCHALTFHSRNGQWAYEAGGSGGGAAFSSDGGQTWQQPRAGLARSYGVACAADPGQPERWYVAVAPSPWNAFGDQPEAYLYRAGVGGAWEPIGWEPHPLSAMPVTLATDPQQPGHLYAGTRHGVVWHTADCGNTWQPLDFRLEHIWLTMTIC